MRNFILGRQRLPALPMLLLASFIIFAVCQNPGDLLMAISRRKAEGDY